MRLQGKIFRFLKTLFVPFNVLKTTITIQRFQCKNRFEKWTTLGRDNCKYVLTHGKPNQTETLFCFFLNSIFTILPRNQENFSETSYFFGHYFLHFLVFFGQDGCTYCFTTIFFGIFSSNNWKNYPKCNISLVKYQIFLLFIKIFLGTRFLGSSENLDFGIGYCPQQALGALAIQTVTMKANQSFGYQRIFCHLLRQVCCLG